MSPHFLLHSPSRAEAVWKTGNADGWMLEKGEVKRYDAHFHLDPNGSLNKSAVHLFISCYSLSCVQNISTLPQG